MTSRSTCGSAPSSSASDQFLVGSSTSVPLLLLTPPQSSTSDVTTPTCLHGDHEGRGPEEGDFLLPRSSPVVSRRHRPSSWHGDDSAPNAPSSSRRGRPSVLRTEGAESRPRSCPATSVEAESRPRSRPSSASPQRGSVSSHLNHFLLSLLHPPLSGQPGLAEERRGRRPNSYQAPPSEGRSSSSRRRCISGIPEFSDDILKRSSDLEKENAHFVLVDLVLEVLEGVKWTLSSDTRATPTREQATPTRDARIRRRDTQRQTRRSRRHPRTHAGPTAASDHGAEDAGADSSAEALAQQLVLDFRRRWIPSQEARRGRRSLRSSLQELPGTGSEVAGGGLMDRMRGSVSWAPPRLQIIFTLQPTLRRSEVLALQKFRCAGCGTEVEPRYMKRLRLCEYLGRYFCESCHAGSESVIPARVITNWDFNRFPVSKFSEQLLDSVWFLPLFDLRCLAAKLQNLRVKELERFTEVVEQLILVRRQLGACRFSDSVLSELRELPSHLIEDQPPLVSMNDLLQLRKGHLGSRARAALHAAVGHVERCQLCQARGFICEICGRGRALFPFQTDVCSRCPECKSCFHKRCLVARPCPKCLRVRARNTPGGGARK